MYWSCHPLLMDVQMVILTYLVTDCEWVMSAFVIDTSVIDAHIIMYLELQPLSDSQMVILLLLATDCEWPMVAFLVDTSDIDAHISFSSWKEVVPLLPSGRAFGPSQCCSHVAFLSRVAVVSWSALRGCSLPLPFPPLGHVCYQLY